MASASKELSYDKLRYNCDPTQFKFETTADLKPLREIIGQERAVAAIDFGVNIKTYLFNAVRNQSLKYLKKANREDTYKSEDITIEYDPDTPESKLLEKEVQESIQNAVNELPPKCREIFCMNRFDGLI